MVTNQSIGMIIVAFIVIFIPFAFAFDWPKRSRQKTNMYNKNYWDNVFREFEGILFYVSPGEKESHEHQHREEEKGFWRASVFLAILTISIGSLAVFFAGFAYKAARDQADTAQRALMSTQRAFVYVKDDFPSFQFVILNKTYPVYIYNPQWLAIGVTQPVGLEVSTVCQPVYVNQNIPPIDFTFYRRSVGPGQQFKGSACFLTQEYAQLVQNGKIYIAVINKAEYFDIFGTAHTT